MPIGVFLYNSAMFWRTTAALIKTMRPQQWIKNGLLFTALVFDQKLNNVPALLDTLAGFFLFSSAGQHRLHHQ